MKLWKLKDPDKRRECQERFLGSLEGCREDMEILEKKMLDTCKEICGETTGRRGRERETWWWNEDVQRVIREKNAAFQRWQRTGEVRYREEYRRKETRQKGKLVNLISTKSNKVISELRSKIGLL